MPRKIYRYTFGVMCSHHTKKELLSHITNDTFLNKRTQHSEGVALYDISNARKSVLQTCELVGPFASVSPVQYKRNLTQKHFTNRPLFTSLGHEGSAIKSMSKRPCANAQC